MLSPKELVEQYPEKVEEFLKVTFALSEEQTAAFEHVTPMTQEMFESCFDTLMSVNAIQTCMGMRLGYSAKQHVHNLNVIIVVISGKTKGIP